MDIKKKQEQLRQLSAELKKLTVDELKAREQEVIKKADDNDKRIAELKFDLPKENYKIVATAIQKCLNKKTVEWQFTLGLLSMYEFWNPDEFPKKIGYPMLDSTLRTLGELQFTGYEEWAMVVAMNKYFEALHQAYEEATETIYDIANEHNAIIDELQLRVPKPEAEAEVKAQA